MIRRISHAHFVLNVGEAGDLISDLVNAKSGDSLPRLWQTVLPGDTWGGVLIK